MVLLRQALCRPHDVLCSKRKRNASRDSSFFMYHHCGNPLVLLGMRLREEIWWLAQDFDRDDGMMISRRPNRWASTDIDPGPRHTSASEIPIALMAAVRGSSQPETLTGRRNMRTSRPTAAVSKPAAVSSDQNRKQIMLARFIPRGVTGTIPVSASLYQKRRTPETYMLKARRAMR
jgi:hypothetical protein